MRRLLMLVPVAFGAVTLASAALVPAGAGGAQIGAAPLTIEKEVDGHVPDDTEFTVKVECNVPTIFTPSGAVTSAKVDFDSEGEPDGANTITFVAKADCTVTETHDGDAEDVSYECEGQSGSVATGGEAGSELGGPAAAAPAPPVDPCVTHGPQDDPMHVLIRSEGQSATVTVTNEFPDPVKPTPVPAAPVVVSPTFTG
jgi:hypothetical protein